MRRKEKYILKGAIIVGGATAIIDILMQWKELKWTFRCHGPS